MKRFLIFYIFLSTNLIGQDSPMFDSLDYYLRNKIVNVHFTISEWYYSPPWKYIKSTFDKTTNKLDGHSFSLRDTVIQKDPKDKLYNDTVRYFFDKKKRLNTKTVTTGTPAYSGPFQTTTIYIYADSTSKKLSKTIIESPYFIEERNFYYEGNVLAKRICTNSNKISKEVSVETFLYEYYPDKKLKKETRKVKNTHCKTNCEGTIEYKYDTD